MEDKFGEDIDYVAALHADHAPHRHVHVVALVPGKLTKKDLAIMRGRGQVAAYQQRKILDRTLTPQRERPYPVPYRTGRPLKRERPVQIRPKGLTRRSETHLTPVPVAILPEGLSTCTCPSCNAFHIHHRGNSNSVHRCKNCKRPLHAAGRLRLFPSPNRRSEKGRGREMGWEL